MTLKAVTRLQCDNQRQKGKVRIIPRVVLLFGPLQVQTTIGNHMAFLLSVDCSLGGTSSFSHIVMLFV